MFQFLIWLIAVFVCVQSRDDVTVFTVATDDTHGLQQFLRSAKVYGINVEVLGKGQKWEGGNMNFAGGGQKINLLKNKLEQINTSDKEHIILFTDSYDVIFLGSIDEIVKRFKTFKSTRVLFSAEPFCWPDAKLASHYPLTEVVNPYLNSGGFIGYVQEIYEIVNFVEVNDKDDDQLFYTKVYLDKQMRESLKISLDHHSTIFQNLNGALSDVKLVTNGTDWPYIENVATKQKPLILHGNGPSKLTLHSLGNYLAKAWSVKDGCFICAEKRIELKEDSLPNVMLAVFVEQPTPFMEEFLQSLLDLNYPKNKIHLILRNNVQYHETEVQQFFDTFAEKFASAKRIKPSDFISEAEARNIAKERCVNSACDYLLALDSSARLRAGALRSLLASGFEVVAPLLARPGQLWTNFWGAVSANGFYARSSDYMDIVNGERRGTWNVPFITNCYLVKASVLASEAAKSVTYYKEDMDPDMAFCSSLRDAGIFMHVTNEESLGHLVNAEGFEPSRTNPDLYQVQDNKLEWEGRYLHPDYALNFQPNRTHLMPCPDVYWFPMMTARFCSEWIEVMEAFGKWSDGSNSDERLQGGYEAVPTRDIHMNQVGLDRQWLHVLRQYVRPLQEMVFTGYYHDPPASLMNFVVRYRPEEQPSLKPHHDSSTYTINLALNSPDTDYAGGGCRFLRYDCAVRDTRRGWLLMHPGRLTHFHEGLAVTRGTRYIMISFVDP